MTELSAYELQRLETIAINNKVLASLGLENAASTMKADLTKEKKPRKEKRQRDDANVVFERRVQPKRDKKTSSFSDNFFSECDAALPDDEEFEYEEKKRKLKRSRDKRQVNAPKLYTDDYTNLAKRQKKAVEATVKLMVPPNKSSWLVTDDDREREKQLNLMCLNDTLKSNFFKYGFTTQHMKDSQYPPELIDMYQSYCDYNANVRFPKLLQHHTVDEIRNVAKAVTNNDDSSIDDVQLVQSYKQELACFPCNSKELSPWDRTRVTFTPICICVCGGYFALKASDGEMRAHACRT